MHNHTVRGLARLLRKTCGISFAVAFTLARASRERYKLRELAYLTPVEKLGKTRRAARETLTLGEHVHECETCYPNGLNTLMVVGPKGTMAIGEI